MGRRCRTSRKRSHIRHGRLFVETGRNGRNERGHGRSCGVLGAMEIIGEPRPEKNVVAIIASTDNMVSGEAFKPDDVITSLSGKTIEVLNTDAEGRLVLADAVTYAKQSGASLYNRCCDADRRSNRSIRHDKTGA